MTDSAIVFPPGCRLTDASTGAPLSGAVIKFFDAGTTTPKTVHADAGLSVALGTSVVTDSLGYPTSDGTTKTLIYVGSAPYKIRIETSAGVEIATHDNIKGAVEVSTPTDLSVVFARPVVTKSLDYAIVADDQSKIFAANCSGGQVELTLPSAVTVGDGWFTTVQHAGSANVALVTAVSGQTIASGHLNYGSTLAIGRSGEEVTVVSDGGNWRVISHTGPHIKNAQGVLTVEDRLSAPSGSPVTGAWYLLTSSPSGAWSGYAEHDLAQYTGSSWVKITPPTNCGWWAYVKDESNNYQFVNSSWVAANASTTRSGTALLADQAAMEAQSGGRAVTADVQHHHPLHPKVAARINLSGTASVVYGLGTASVTDHGTGDITLTWTAPLANFVFSAIAKVPSSTGRSYITETARTSTTLRLSIWYEGLLYDSTELNIIILGDA